MVAAKRFKTATLHSYQEFLLSGSAANAEFIDGEILQKAQPSGRHGQICGSVLGQIVPRFSRKSIGDGSGGWWILTEVAVHYRPLERVLQSNISGWKRERVPACPQAYPVEERPDWVCEVCHSTRKKDTTIVPETLAASGVPYYWLLDVEAENLQVFELVAGGKYALIQSLFREDGDVVIHPFGPLSLNVGVLLGDDPE